MSGRRTVGGIRTLDFRNGRNVELVLVLARVDFPDGCFDVILRGDGALVRWNDDLSWEGDLPEVDP